MNVLAHLLFLLLSTFVVLTTSVTSSSAHLGGHHTAPQLSAADASYADTDPFGLSCCGDSCVTLAEGNCDGLDEGALLRFVHGLPEVAIGGASSPSDVLFNFLRGRTSAPRAPPAQV